MKQYYILLEEHTIGDRNIKIQISMLDFKNIGRGDYVDLFSIIKKSDINYPIYKTVKFELDRIVEENILFRAKYVIHLANESFIVMTETELNKLIIKT